MNTAVKKQIANFACFLAVASLIGCGGADEKRSTSAPTIVYSSNINGADNPWPDDRYLDATGGGSLTPDWFADRLLLDEAGGAQLEFIRQLTENIDRSNDRFPGYGPIIFKTNRGVDLTSIKGAAFIIAGAGGEAVTVPFDPLVFLDENIVELRPRRSLYPSTTHTVILTEGMTCFGAPLIRPSGYRPDSGAIETAAKIGIAPQKILLSWRFTTGDSTAPLIDIAAGLAGDAGNGIGMDEVQITSIADYNFIDKSKHVLQVMEARYRSAKVVVNHDAPGGIELTSEIEPVPLFIAYPKSVTAEPAKTVLIMHGLMGSRHGFLEDVDRFCELGFAVLAIDAVEHGDRAPGAPGINVFNFIDPTISVRNLAQTTIDLLVLSEIIRREKGFDYYEDGKPDIEADRLHFFGASMGSLIGSSFITIADDLSAAVLEVPGGGMTDIFQSDFFTTFLKLIIGDHLGLGIFSAELLRFLRVYIPLLQFGLDPIEPLNFAYRFTNLKPADEKTNLLLQMAVGDGLIPNRATDKLVDTFNFKHSWNTPAEDPAGISAAWAWDPLDYDRRYGAFAHGAVRWIEPGLSQRFNYLASGGTSITGDPALK